MDLEVLTERQLHPEVDKCCEQKLLSAGSIGVRSAKVRGEAALVPPQRMAAHRFRTQRMAALVPSLVPSVPTLPGRPSLMRAGLIPPVPSSTVLERSSRAAAFVESRFCRCFLDDSSSPSGSAIKEKDGGNGVRWNIWEYKGKGS